jgi:hypothetical protein
MPETASYSTQGGREMSETRTSRRWGRSVVAVVVGIVVGAVLSLGVDEVLHVTGMYPPWGRPMSDGLFALATAYRLLFSVLGCYVIARLAPDRPMLHALVGGAIGLVLCIVGAVTTWNTDLGPHWYSVLLAVTALPCAWIGGRFWTGSLKESVVGGS